MNSTDIEEQQILKARLHVLESEHRDLDDVIERLLGLTCEINNSDAEGRLILADGVAHATALPPRLPGLAADTLEELSLIHI